MGGVKASVFTNLAPPLTLLGSSDYAIKYVARPQCEERKPTNLLPCTEATSSS